VNFGWMAEQGMVSTEDFDLFSFANDANEAWRQLEAHGVHEER